MPDVLSTIYAAKALHVAKEMEREPYEVVRTRAFARRSERRSFDEALHASRGIAIVAEIKRASPSAGIITEQFDPLAVARLYQSAGADAISVLTEQDYFMGELRFLDEVRAVTTCPILRKDFLSTRYEVAQSAAYGADCILLIVAGLSDPAMRLCMREAAEYDLDVLVEIHDEGELERAVALGARVIGVNNRNLRTMATDLGVSERLLPLVPGPAFAIAESGMRNAHDVRRLSRVGARGALVGEALMRSADPAAMLAELKESCAPR